MDYAFEKDWIKLERLMEERFGEPPDLTTMIFTVGLRNAGRVSNPSRKTKNWS